MPSNINLVRAHFENALTALSKLNGNARSQGHERLLEEARLAHGAGARRLKRIPPAPYLSHALQELRTFEHQVRWALARAENEDLTTPYFMMPAAQ